MKAVNLCGWLLALTAVTVYLLTLEPTVSFWDCGEFIATAYNLQVPHPPGAPLYQLLAHLFCLLAGSHVERVALCCNALSAVAAGLTVMFLYWTIERMAGTGRAARPRVHFGAVAGALCYLFCHTAWFSAVESEVYSLASLISAVILWAAWRWRDSADDAGADRWLLLVALLTGMGICVHQLTLLTLPAVLYVVAATLRGRRITRCRRRGHTARLMLLALLLFSAGLSPYLIVPLRAAGHPPLNCGNPDNAERFYAYITRKQYEKAPLYPRMWRHRDHDDANAALWSGGTDGLKGNLRYYVTYQLGFMYGRYLCDNFIARHNERRDATVWYLLPMALALAGLAAQRRRHRTAFRATLLLFFTAGPLLNIYLNHPCYEPRERDYAYILSFYAVALWTGAGAVWLLRVAGRRKLTATIAVAAVTAAPVLTACGNWDDHDRSRRYVARDVAMNLLHSCDKGALLFTFGDNDTFPLWYAQQVEGARLDVRCENINLIGYDRFFTLLEEQHGVRPCYLTQYAYDRLHEWFDGRLRLEGMTYRISDTRCPAVDTAAFLHHLADGIRWHDTTGVFIDRVGRSFLKQYEINKGKIVPLQHECPSSIPTETWE